MDVATPDARAGAVEVFPRAGLVQDYSAALMRQEQGRARTTDHTLLELPVPAAHARLAEPS